MNAALETPAPHVRPTNTWACIGVLTGVRLALIAMGVARAQRLIEWLSPLGPDRPRPGTRATGVVPPQAIADRLAAAAVFFPGRAACLEHSLALYYLLRRRALAPQLRIGVHPAPFRAHAWVELAGVPLNDDPAYVRTFVPLVPGA